MLFDPMLSTGRKIPQHFRRRLLGAVVGGLGAVNGVLSCWAGRQAIEDAAAPAGPKGCDFVFPSSTGTAATAVVPADFPARLFPAAQRGGTINDASCLNKTPVHGVLLVRDADDVAHALRYARDHGLEVTAAGERHSMGGQSFVRDGLVLDMRGMRRMSLSADRAILTVESGASWAAVQRFLDRHGCAVKAMQSINIFTVGGSLSVNAHGIAHDPGPVSATVRSLRVMTADGEIRTASPTENRELFRAVLGGYGLLGVILEARLDVVPNVMYESRTEYMSYRDFPAFYARRVAGNAEIGLFYARLSVSPSGYLREVAAHLFTAAPRAGTPPPLTPDDNVTLERFVINNSKRGPLGRYLRWTLEKHLQPVLETCSRNQAMGGTEACLVSRNQEMYDSMDYLRNRLRDTDILQEYFVPYAAMPAFTDGLRAIVAKHGANLLNVTLRRVERDDITTLPYATGDMFGLVLYFNQRLDDVSSRALAATTRDLVDLALRHQGTYYLPYRLDYTREQLRAAYPGLDDFFRLKAKYDPRSLFVNQMYEKYRA
jgi:FAD/FMN-containing dehydrogenase